MENKVDLNHLADEINNKHGAILEIQGEPFNDVVHVNPENLIRLMEELKSNYSYDLLFNVTAVEYPENYTAVYTVVASSSNRALFVKSILSKDDPEIPSLTAVYKAATVQERETFDLMGIRYLNHPNLARVLLPEDFEGHPLRKDYPMKDRV
jgi:NADH-quinone oxidoreductase subunit C